MRFPQIGKHLQASPKTLFDGIYSKYHYEFQVFHTCDIIKDFYRDWRLSRIPNLWLLKHVVPTLMYFKCTISISIENIMKNIPLYQAFSNVFYGNYHINLELVWWKLGPYHVFTLKIITGMLSERFLSKMISNFYKSEICK